MKKMLCILCAAVVISVMSCQKANVEVGPTHSEHSLDEVKVVDGRLVFPDHQTFGEAFDLMGKEGSEDWLKKYPNFKSLRSAFDEMQERGVLISAKDKDAFKHCYRYQDGGEQGKLLRPAISGQIMSSLVNAQGMVQIGDSIMRVSDEKVLKVHVKSLAELDEPQSALVKEYKVISNLHHKKEANARTEYDNTVSVQPYFGEYQDNSGNNYRFMKVFILTMYTFGEWRYYFREGRFGFAWYYESLTGLIHEKQNGSNWNPEDTDGWSRGWASIYFTGPIDRYFSYPPETVNGMRNSYFVQASGRIISGIIWTSDWGIDVTANAGGLTATKKGGGTISPLYQTYGHI